VIEWRKLLGGDINYYPILFNACAVRPELKAQGNTQLDPHSPSKVIMLGQ